MAGRKRRRSDRADRPAVGSAGRPWVGQRQTRQQFSKAIALGLAGIRRLSGRWDTLVPRQWRHAQSQPRFTLRALAVVCREGRHSDPACARLRSA
jgi:hypothetical protein